MAISLSRSSRRMKTLCKARLLLCLSMMILFSCSSDGIKLSRRNFFLARGSMDDSIRGGRSRSLAKPAPTGTFSFTASLESFHYQFCAARAAVFVSAVVVAAVVAAAITATVCASGGAARRDTVEKLCQRLSSSLRVLMIKNLTQSLVDHSQCLLESLL